MIQQALSTLKNIPYLQVLLILLTAGLGFALAKFISMFVGRQIERTMDQTSALVVRRLIFYAVLVLVLVVILAEMEVSLAALLTAGGLFGVALGFAAQTAVSNIISGVFLIFERPFNVSDVIKVDNNTGVVQSIDLLSTKIRTFDNQSWRMPNEKLLKSDIITITRYDIRRSDLSTSISYDDDIQTARDVMLECAENHPLVMAEPEPVTLVNRMGDSGIEITLRYWFYRTDFIQVFSDLTQDVKIALEEAGLTIPFPHRTLYLRQDEDWQQAQLMEADADDKDAKGSSSAHNERSS